MKTIEKIPKENYRVTLNPKRNQHLFIHVDGPVLTSLSDRYNYVKAFSGSVARQDAGRVGIDKENEPRLFMKDKKVRIFFPNKDTENSVPEEDSVLAVKVFALDKRDGTISSAWIPKEIILKMQSNP